MITFKHSGDLGDIIYSLPTVQALLNREGKTKCIFYLFINDSRTKMTRRIAEFIIPLLLIQDYIDDVIITESDIKVDYDLNTWRHGDIFNRHIALKVADEFQLSVDIKSRWLQLPPQVETLQTKEMVVLARSIRNRSRNFKWDEVITGLFGKFVFIGVPQEYEDMKFNKSVPYMTFNNALEMAIAIDKCKLFIGNQSFPYAIAEALKVPRIQETCEFCPNCMPQGESGWSSIGMTTDKIRELVKFVGGIKDEQNKDK